MYKGFLILFLYASLWLFFKTKLNTVVYKKEITISNITILINTTEEQTIECLFKPIDDMKVNEVTINDIMENFIKSNKTKVTIYLKSTREVFMEFMDEGYDDFLYNIVAICYNVPWYGVLRSYHPTVCRLLLFTKRKLRT